jgi:hypothetical protein
MYRECGVAQDGVHLINELPWATEGSGFTLLFEAFVMLLAEQMPVAAIARLVQEEDTRLWRLITRLVEAAHAAADWSQVSSIAIDETSSRRGRCYVTVFLDAQTHRLLYVAPGRTSLAIEQFNQRRGFSYGRFCPCLPRSSPVCRRETYPGTRIPAVPSGVLASGQRKP